MPRPTFQPRRPFQGVSPVLLSSACDVLENNSAIPDSGQLSYPFRKAIILEEIRWTMRTAATEALNLGAIVSTRMALGQNYLMRDPVPVWLLGTTMTRTQEEGADTLLGTDTVFSHYRWRLPEPLFVDAGQVLSSVFSRGIDGFGTINVQVSYAGRTVAPNQPRPAVIPIPYAAPWATTLGQTYQQSNEKHLFNPFDKDLRVQRLTGRLFSFVAGGTLVAVGRTTPRTAGASTTILMNDSWGGKMINNNTGPGDVFDDLRAAWTVDTVMPPKGIYEVRAWNIGALQILHVGLIGTREERT